MSYEPEQCAQQAKVLLDAAKQCTVMQLAASLRARGNEWSDAVTRYRRAIADGETPVIELAGTVEVGMRLYTRAGAVGVLRVNSTMGAPSHQVISDEGYPSWVNYVSPSSPVVVLLEQP